MILVTYVGLEGLVDRPKHRAHPGAPLGRTTPPVGRAGCASTYLGFKDFTYLPPPVVPPHEITVNTSHGHLASAPGPVRFTAMPDGSRHGLDGPPDGSPTAVEVRGCSTRKWEGGMEETNPDTPSMGICPNLRSQDFRSPTGLLRR